MLGQLIFEIEGFWTNLSWLPVHSQFVRFFIEIFFPTTFAKRSVGNKESGLVKIVVDMLRPKIKLR